MTKELVPLPRKQITSAQTGKTLVPTPTPPQRQSLPHLLPPPVAAAPRCCRPPVLPPPGAAASLSCRPPLQPHPFLAAPLCGRPLFWPPFSMAPSLLWPPLAEAASLCGCLPCVAAPCCGRLPLWLPSFCGRPPLSPHPVVAAPHRRQSPLWTPPAAADIPRGHTPLPPPPHVAALSFGGPLLWPPPSVATRRRRIYAMLARVLSCVLQFCTFSTLYFVISTRFSLCIRASASCGKSAIKREKDVDEVLKKEANTVARGGSGCVVTGGGERWGGRISCQQHLWGGGSYRVRGWKETSCRGNQWPAEVGTGHGKVWGNIHWWYGKGSGKRREGGGTHSGWGE